MKVQGQSGFPRGMPSTEIMENLPKNKQARKGKIYGLSLQPGLQILDSYATLYFELLDSLNSCLLETGQSKAFSGGKSRKCRCTAYGADPSAARTGYACRDAVCADVLEKINYCTMYFG